MVIEINSLVKLRNGLGIYSLIQTGRKSLLPNCNPYVSRNTTSVTQ